MADTHYLPEICYFNMSMSYLKEGMVTDASKTAYELSVLNPESVFSKEINLHLNKVFYVDNKGPELSIIVPVYNSGQYLEKCLNSIVNQRFKNFELIIVNDGSTDNSAEIIARFAELDDRVVVIENKKASGNPGTPRNQALDICKGAYIGFVDSDDWLDNDYYSSLMEKALAGFPDIVFSNGFKNCLRTGEVSVRKYNNAGFNDPKSTRYKFHDSFMIWDKVFHRRLIKTFDIKLGETPAAVDVPFIFKAYYYCATVSYSDGLFGYNYRRESESSVTVAHRKNSNCDFEFESYKNVLSWSEDVNVTEHYKQLINVKLINSLLYTLGLINKNHFSDFLKKIKIAFNKINKAKFKKFCIDNKKWWALQRVFNCI
ncbi:glycosyltransferase family 2 protein [Arsukibacterium sp.]|uniref:glycosyltransferase family 2 protein n=1 Tax=Arsukibacterium sp. TaxID=1977258 RepID=UPI001BD536A5|nr:glycosyltransferase family 2 protein [Arsukibacterium sp.]